MSRVKRAAAKLLSDEEDFHRSFGISLFGADVWTRQQETILHIVGLFESTASYPAEHRERIRKGGLVYEKLNPLLEQAFAKLPSSKPFDGFRSAITRGILDGLAQLDAQVFHEFASAIEAAKRIRETGEVHPLHANILRLAERLAPEDAVPLRRKGELTLTSKDFTKKLNGEFNTCHSEVRVRNAAIQMGFTFQKAKEGRPKLKQ